MNPMDCRPKLIREMKRRFRLNETIAEDAVDEAISRLFRVELKAENIFPLLYQITKNILLDRKKRLEVAQRNIKILRNSAVRPPTPLQNSMVTELENSLKQELLVLRERDRKIFELYYIDGLSHEEIALKIGVSVASSKGIAFRVRTVLRDRLKRFAS